MNGRESGVCVRWTGSFGFLRPADGGKDVFVGYHAIESEEKFRSLVEGQSVTFERGTDHQGRPCAVSVRIAASAA